MSCFAARYYERFKFKERFILGIISLCLGLHSIHANEERAWQKFHQEGVISLYRSQERDSGLIPFRASGTFEGSLEDYLKVLLHHREKPQWAPKLKKVDVHKQMTPNRFIFSEYYKTPWPATDREFLLEGEVQFVSNSHVRLIAQNSTELSYVSEDHIKCDVKVLNLDLKRVASNKTSITFEFYGDMMGWMPVWLINIIQKKWPMRFLQGLSSQVKAGKAYPTKEYLGLERPQ